MKNINMSISKMPNVLASLGTFYLTLLMTCLLTGCQPDKPGKSTKYSKVTKDISKSIEASMKKYDMTGVSIALVDGDAEKPVVWSQGFGYADKENKVAAKPTTVYQAGSIVKLFTGMAIMQLADEGKLNLDKPVQTYLPNLKINSHFKNAAPVTIRNMLTHHSGLPSNYLKANSTASISGIKKLNNLNIDLAAKPNTQYKYSNLAYELLGLVIENVSGLSYKDYIQQKLLTPMGMSQSHINETLSTKENHAKGYFDNKNQPIPFMRDIAAGALNTSVLDLAKFAQMTFPNQSNKVLSNTTLQNMQSPQFISNSPFVVNSSGLSWYLSDMLNKRTKGHAGLIVGHDGSTKLFTSALFTLPKHKLAVAIMTNGVTEKAPGVTAIANELLAKAFEVKTKVKIATKPDFELPNIIPTTQDALDNMPGMWISDNFGALQIQKKNNRLVWILNNTLLPLVNRGNDTYYVDYVSAGLTPDQLGGASVLGLKYRKNSDTEALDILQSNTHIEYAEKLKPQNLSSTWKNRLGNYQLVNIGDALPLFSKVRLSHDNGILVMEAFDKSIYIKNADIIMAYEVINDKKAFQYGVGRNKGYTLTFKTAPDGTERMYLSGYEFKKVS